MVQLDGTNIFGVILVPLWHHVAALRWCGRRTAPRPPTPHPPPPWRQPYRRAPLGGWATLNCAGPTPSPYPPIRPLPSPSRAVALSLSPPSLTSSNPLTLELFFTRFFGLIEEQGILLHCRLFFFRFNWWNFVDQRVTLRTNFLFFANFVILTVANWDLLIVVLNVCNVLVDATIIWSIYVVMLIFRWDMNGVVWKNRLPHIYSKKIP